MTTKISLTQKQFNKDLLQRASDIWINDVESREGWLWPSNDIGCFKFLKKRNDCPELISKFCKKTDTLIQAGGNAGMYVNLYQTIFKTIYTFEPDPINFYCLTQNTSKNVIKFQGCLGNTHTMIDLDYSTLQSTRPNFGGFSVQGSGKIPVFTIDSFNFDSCDLIHLDIEGYEKFALEGAKNTIGRYKPTICVELNGLGEKYNSSDQDVRNLLDSLNYIKVGEVYEDFVFKHKDQA